MAKLMLAALLVGLLSVTGVAAYRYSQNECPLTGESLTCSHETETPCCPSQTMKPSCCAGEKPGCAAACDGHDEKP